MYPLLLIRPILILLFCPRLLLLLPTRPLRLMPRHTVPFLLEFTFLPATPSHDDFLPIFALPKKRYKPVALKTRPVLAELPDKFRIVRNIIGDPLADIPTLSPNPPPFQPTSRYTTDRRDALHKVHCDFLTPEELALMDHFMSVQNKGFAWTDAERGRFRTDFFPPIDFPVVPHTPWVQRNIPIPPGIYDQVCAILHKKIEAGVYKP